MRAPFDSIPASQAPRTKLPQVLTPTSRKNRARPLVFGGEPAHDHSFQRASARALLPSLARSHRRPKPLNLGTLDAGDRCRDRSGTGLENVARHFEGSVKSFLPERLRRSGAVFRRASPRSIQPSPTSAISECGSKSELSTASSRGSRTTAANKRETHAPHRRACVCVSRQPFPIAAVERRSFRWFSARGMMVCRNSTGGELQDGMASSRSGRLPNWQEPTRRARPERRPTPRCTGR